MSVKRREFLFAGLALRPSTRRALVIDGRHNHDWRATTRELKGILESAGFLVEVATAPRTNEELVDFRPRLTGYQLVVPNYTDFGNGGVWNNGLKADFAACVSAGAGVLIVHAASSAFPEWREYNEITGLGGWGGRDERSGPYLYWKNGITIREEGPAEGGHHGKQHPFTVVVRAESHPIVTGLPLMWQHATDELFDTLRGPARNLEVLATAWSDPSTGGSGRHEPVLFTVRYGKGRAFHTALGHSAEAMRSSGFVDTLKSGALWASAN
ncbi:MAG: ThuA domain-containing protein [Bryobacterales bacterium]|nr:ThuA domain-containing protein [Bryobacterales bacterium]